LPGWLKRGERESEQRTAVVGVPFLNLLLASGEKVWEITVENHFISSLKPEERIVLVSKGIPEPKVGVLSARLLKPAFESPEEALAALEEGYKLLVASLQEAGSGAEEQAAGSKSSFGLRYLASELRRVFVGGLGGGPPLPELPSRVRLEILAKLYEAAVFREGRRPSLASWKKFYAPFSYDASKGSFKELHKDFASFAKILTLLAKSGELDLKELERG